METAPPSVCVYCGSSRAALPAHRDAAAALGAAIAARGWTLVYGAGRTGLMGALADAALERGGRVVGAIPESMVEQEVAHDSLHERFVCRTMHERKAWMAARADAFVALPGGYGTLEELFEMLTWRQIDLHAKPVGLLDVDGFFDPLLAFLDHARDCGLLRPRHREMLLVETDPDTLLDRLAAG